MDDRQPGNESGSAVHVPVMLERSVDLLGPALHSHSVVVDCTLGLGGHAEALLQAFPDVRLMGVDRDSAALQLASERLAPFGSRFRAGLGVFDQANALLDEAGWGQPSGYLFDLGVSSLQLDSDARGFAYSRETPLDMRMDSKSPMSAADVLSDYSRGELARVFSQYGEERYSRRIAAAIVARREREPLRTSHELTELVVQALPPGPSRSGHPAKRIFQALRIEVNDELGALRRALTDAVHRLVVGGRIVTLAYHSLEDRIAKRTFASGTVPSAPHDLPVVPEGFGPFLKIVSAGAEQASPAEAEANPRARSVRLRAVEKTAKVPANWLGAA